MRTLTAIAMGIVLGGIGCAGAERAPKAPVDDRAFEEPPMTAPDDPTPTARPKLTAPVTIGQSGAGIPSGARANDVAAVGSPSGPRPSSAPGPTRRDMFAEDRANQPHIRQSTIRSYYQYGRHPMHVNNPGPVISAPRGTPPVGGNWPTAH